MHSPSMLLKRMSLPSININNNKHTNKNINMELISIIQKAPILKSISIYIKIVIKEVVNFHKEVESSIGKHFHLKFLEN